MDDLISRQQAIDELNDKYHGMLSDESMKIYQIINWLEQLPSAKPDWISVKKKLPKPRVDVWVCSDLGQMVAYYEEHVETWYGRNYLELLVTAWMPLPDDYKEESNDG